MRPSCLPGPGDADLLQAALAPLSQAREAWRRWRSRNTLEACHYVSHRLLSLISRRLPREVIPEADFVLLRGLYRYHWTRNQLLTRSACSILGSLQAEGVEALLLKGLALAHLVYRDLGVRPMNDFDVLIKPKQRNQAVAVLEAAGWRISHPLPDLSATHGAEFCNQQDQRFDLHWYSTDESRWPDADQDFWNHAVPLRLSDRVLSRTPDPAHLLLHVLIHGVKETEASPLVWVADACTLLMAFPDLEWSRLVESCRQRRVVLPVLMGLRYLQEELGRDLPGWVLEELQSTPVGPADRLYFQSKIAGGNGWLSLTRPYLDYLRTERPGWGDNLPGFLNFLCRRWGLASIWLLPRRVWQALRRRWRWRFRSS